jgi:hypothetical protein
VPSVRRRPGHPRVESGQVCGLASIIRRSPAATCDSRACDVRRACVSSIESSPLVASAATPMAAHEVAMTPVGGGAVTLEVRGEALRATDLTRSLAHARVRPLAARLRACAQRIALILANVLRISHTNVSEERS